MIESLNMTLWKTIKNRVIFPSDEGVFKIQNLPWKISANDGQCR